MTTYDPMAARATSTASGSRVRYPGAPETLRNLYVLYCRHEARELVQMLPPEGRRNLLRVLARSGEPSISRLLDLARTLLPLPPYDAWVDAYVSDRASYLERLGISEIPERDEPVTVAIRPVAGRWWAHLNLRQRDRRWFGSISFHPEASLSEDRGPQVGLALRTAEIFRGEDAEEIKQRFMAFGEAAMQGFLRSVTP